MAMLSALVANAALETRPLPEHPGLVQAPDDGRGEIDDSASLAWVDPIVTGPVSPEYRERRLKAGCDDAVWPNVPALCFPK